MPEPLTQDRLDSRLLKAAPESSDDWDDDTWAAWARTADRVHAAKPSRAELLATVTELRQKLATAERQAKELDETLAERDEQIAGLLAAEPTLDDDQPGVPW